MPQSNGGIAQTSRISAYPMISAATKAAGLYAFDPTLGFNDLVNPANYSFKVEEVVPGKVPTVSKVIVVYRDLGLVSVKFTLTSTDDNQTVTSITTTVILGNLVPTGRIMTRNDIGLTKSGQNIQLSLSRAPGAGNLALVKIILVGTVENS